MGKRYPNKNCMYHKMGKIYLKKNQVYHIMGRFLPSKI